MLAVNEDSYILLWGTGLLAAAAVVVVSFVGLFCVDVFPVRAWKKFVYLRLSVLILVLSVNQSFFVVQHGVCSTLSCLL